MNNNVKQPESSNKQFKKVSYKIDYIYKFLYLSFSEVSGRAEMEHWTKMGKASNLEI